MALSGTVAATLQFTQTSALDQGTATFPASLAKRIALASGVATDQADMLFADTRTIAASGTDDLDEAGTLSGVFGTTLTFAKVKVILVVAAAGNTNNVVIGGDASAAFVGPFGDATDTIAVKPGGVFLIAHPGAGWPVTPTTADILQIANSGGTTGVTYDIVIIGTSA